MVVAMVTHLYGMPILVSMVQHRTIPAYRDPALLAEE